MTIRIPRRLFSFVGWSSFSLAGAFATGGLALTRGEAIDARWILLAAVCWYTIFYRWYSRFIAAKVLVLDDLRATPAEVHDDGKDFIPTHKWVVYGHHFAAIAGPGPLIGPVLAAQLGFMPGLLWILVGGVLGGCVQDMVILFCSVRRDGRSLGQMAKDLIGPVAGFTALIGVLAIMVILLAVIGLIVVRALDDSPWGTFTIACTIPIAMLMGIYMRYWRPGKVGEASLLGLALILLAVFGGGSVAHSSWAVWFDFSATTLAWMLIVYGFAASTIPVWLLLAPRDYLSTFLKVGVVGGLAAGIALVGPTMQMPALTKFAFDGLGPVWAGNLFPFCFITVACGAISGFHALISSGTTPKLITKESHIRIVGYGGMMMESFVAVMALIAASAMSPGVYFAMNSPPAIVGADPYAAVSTITEWGYPVTTGEMETLATQVGEKTLYARAGGAPTLAVGMAQIFSHLTDGRGMDIWYHFAIMFEVVFILTTLDAGTRVGRFMLQDLLSHAWPRMGEVSWWPGVFATSAMMVGAWGWFLYQGVIDPLGGINSLWPLFGIANQMLAAVALCVATTALVRMGRVRYMWVTALPLVWLLITTQAAAWEKVMHPNPRIGFLSQIDVLHAKIAAGMTPQLVAQTQRQIVNYWLDVFVAVFFAAVVLVVLFESVRVWMRVIRSGAYNAMEAEPVPSRITA